MFDLTPSQSITFTTVTEPMQTWRKKNWTKLSNPTASIIHTETLKCGIRQSVIMEQETDEEGPPQLHLRDSFRYSFTVGGMLNKPAPSA